MTKQVSIILALVVLALVASTGFWYVSHSRPQVATTEPVSVATSKPVEPVTLTYTDSEYPFAFDYPSSLLYEGRVSATEVLVNDAEKDKKSTVLKTITIGAHQFGGQFYGLDFRVERVPIDFKTWVAKNRSECKYELKPIANGYEVVFTPKDPSDDKNICWYGPNGVYLYSQSKGFLVEASAGHAPALEDDSSTQKCGDKQCGALDFRVMQSLRLTK